MTLKYINLSCIFLSLSTPRQSFQVQLLSSPLDAKFHSAKTHSPEDYARAYSCIVALSSPESLYSSPSLSE